MHSLHQASVNGAGRARAGVQQRRAGLKVSPCAASNKPSGSLEERIASGEFTDAGSTKERLTRPLRRALAADPTGLGVCGVALP